jgi:DNA-binding NtrC family response regulator
MMLDRGRIVGRVVEYHSEILGDRDSKRDALAPLAELCPPPRVFFGEACVGTISCVAQDGGLHHRRAEFIPLALKAAKNPAVFVLLATNDLTPQELIAQLSGDSPADELHRTIHQFRHMQASVYAVESLLGESPAMRKVRAQVAAAATSGANALVCGRRGSGRGHVARAIHYHAAGDRAAKLLPLDCRVLNEDLLRRAVDALCAGGRQPRQRPTLLLENLEYLPAPYQSQLLQVLGPQAASSRVLATLCSRHAPRAVAGVAKNDDIENATDARNSGNGTRSVPATIDPALLEALSTITIHVPRLVERLDDLPLLAQSFLETCNRGGDKQVGSIRPEALDLLALHSWPGELDELRDIIKAAHDACTSHEITPADLPDVVQHAAQAAAVRPVRRPEQIVLDELLKTIEKEVLSRALVEAGGNKTEAAELVGMTRPRLYRRLLQLGLVSGPAAEGPDGPEFIEHDPTDESP